MKRRTWTRAIPAAAALLLCFALPALCDEAGISTRVSQIDKYGHAVLALLPEALADAGFALGDVVTVTAGDFSRDMPYFDGFYVERGEFLLCAYPGGGGVRLCVNYGSFASAAGIAGGDEVTLAVKEKAGALALQEMGSLVYTNDRADYESDEVFANFRPVTAGGIKEGRLYRSASPANNKYGRAPYANALAEAAGVRGVMNLANTQEELAELFSAEDFSSLYYKTLFGEGRGIALGLSVDFSDEDFLRGIAKGFSFLSRQETPFLIHCTEGKDRAGFACVLLEALMGATEDEIVSDYMKSYENYYGVQPGTDRYEWIADNNVRVMLQAPAGEGDTDLSAAAEELLLSCGMTEAEIGALRTKLCE